MDFQNILASGQELLALYGLKVLGALMIMFRPFRVGDFIDAAGISIPYPQRDVHLKGQQAA